MCPEWKGQQKTLWAEMLKESGERKHRFTIKDIAADKRCSQADWTPLCYRCGTASAGWGEAGSEVSEWELRELREREEERRAESEELGAAGESGAGEELLLFLPTPSFKASAEED